MPKKALQILKGILQGSEEDINAEYNETNAQFSFANTTLSCRLIEGKYPNFEAVIPKENPNVFKHSTGNLIEFSPSSEYILE